jgi:CheY-like chemotaxis protein
MIEAAVLRQAGYDVATAAAGDEALRLLRETPYRLLVTGLEMRGMGGLDLAEAARESKANERLTVVVVSSSTTTEDTARAALLSVAAFLPKGPAGQEQLLELARKILE